MRSTSTHAGLALAALTTAVALVGCGSMPGMGSSDSKTAAPAAAPAPKSTAGMNERGEVVDSKKVEAGSGQKVKGLGDWEGEITGKPVPGSKFSQLQIGMGVQQVIGLLGQPSDQGAYMTGKAWIPFYFGSDRSRYEAVYKGQGRLIFATSAGWGWGSTGDANLIWIIHSANESGTR